MYLVELETGREQLYESVEALAAAIRANQIGPASRIFHRASSSWVSITVHPEYRRAMAARSIEPLPPFGRRQWTFFGVEPKEREIIEEPAGAAAPAADSEPRPSRRGLRALFARALRGRSAPTGSPEHSHR